MRVETGAAEQHETPLALDSTHSPGVAPATRIFPSGQPEQGGVTDASGERLSQLAAAEADAAAAMSLGMSADHDRRGRYLAAMQPLGGGAGDLMAVSAPPLDPGADPGEALPSGAYYTPPRGY
jgi:hypothetical protein